MSRSRADVGRKSAEVVDRIVKVSTEVETVGGGFDLFLEPWDGADAPWNSKDHTLKFSNKTLELALGARAARAGERFQKFVEALKAVRREFNRARDGINEQLKDAFGCQKSAVALEELLEIVRVFLPNVVLVVRGSEGTVDAMKQNLAKALPTFTAPLCQENNIVHVTVGHSKQPPVAVTYAHRSPGS